MATNREIPITIQLSDAHSDYAKGLIAHAFFKLPDRTLSTDLVQNTFLKTWNYLLRGGKIDSMRAFLYHALNNLIVDEYRKKKTTSLDALLEKGFEPDVDPTERLTNVLDGKIAMRLLRQLPEKYKKILWMRYVQELSVKEISSVTGQTKNSVAVQGHRGLQKLKVLYRQSELH